MMITVTTVSFAEIAQKKAIARASDQQLVDQGHAQMVQQRNSIFQNTPGFFSIKKEPVTFRQHLCLTPHQK